MSRSVLAALRLLLAVLFVASIAVQITAPAFAGAGLQLPAAVILVSVVLAGALCIEAVLVSVWMLVGMVRHDRIFDERGSADRWVRVVIAVLISGALIAFGGAVGILIVLLTSPFPSGSGLVAASAAAAAVSLALALVVIVMRRLLHTAIQLRSELAEVI